jgi:hypothetical protein
MKRFRTKKALVTSAAFALILAAGGAAFAYFTSGGSGTGSAQTGTATALTISQVGAGYDSLIQSNNYSQDQTYGGAGITEFGNAITLSTSSASQLVNVVVAMDNWDTAITNLPITMTITGTPGGAPLTDTQDYSFAAAINSDTPSETNITFNFASQNAFVDQSLVYGISFDTNANDTPTGSSLNVALSSSASNLSVGSDTTPGTVWLKTAWPGIGNDFPTCTTPVATGTFEQVTTDCGPYASGNPGAYGTPTQVAAGSDDIPAVEFNVVGGTTTPLYPGGPSEPVDFAIINPGSSVEHVATVTTTLGTPTSGPGSPACSSSWYALAGGSPGGSTTTLTVNQNVSPGTTLFVPSGLSISMPADNVNQDSCEGQTLPLSFTSN